MLIMLRSKRRRSRAEWVWKLESNLMREFLYIMSPSMEEVGLRSFKVVEILYSIFSLHQLQMTTCIIPGTRPLMDSLLRNCNVSGYTITTGGRAIWPECGSLLNYECEFTNNNNVADNLLFILWWVEEEGFSRRRWCRLCKYSIIMLKCSLSCSAHQVNNIINRSKRSTPQDVNLLVHEMVSNYVVFF